MLNRTNRTPSANPNRLNLGTRNLALVAGGNNGNLTLRTVHPFSTVVVRAGFQGDPGIQREAKPIPAMPKPMMPAMARIPGSSPRPERPSRDFRAWDQGQTASSSQLSRAYAFLREGVSPRAVGNAPRVTPTRGHSRTSLGWSCDRTRFAGRSARAALALVTGAAPTS